VKLAKGIQNLMIATAQNLRKLLRAIAGKRPKSTGYDLLNTAAASFFSLGGMGKSACPWFWKTRQ